MRPKQFQASHIMIKVDPSSNVEERKVLQEKAAELAKKAKAGEDFYNLAYYNSDDQSRYVGGDLGTFHVGQTVKEFENAILSMSPGDISDPVQTMYGYHIIKLISVSEERMSEFVEVKQQIMQNMLSKKLEQKYNEWMLELRKSYSAEKLIEF